MKYFITILLITVAYSTHAQTVAELTQQKKTQLQYLADQIVALQTYAGYVEKGYTIAKKGLDAVSNIKKGDFSMHESYFNSLKVVNPNINSYWKVADIIVLQIKIIRISHEQIKSVEGSQQFTNSEKNYCNNVLSNLLNGCTNVIDQMIFLITDGNTQMKDDERIKRIDGLYGDVKDKYEFEQHFCNETKILAMQRSEDWNDIQTGKALLNITK